MYVDASALVALILSEPDAPDILARMESADRLFTSPTGLWEAVVSCTRRMDWDPETARSAVARYLDGMQIAVVDMPAATADLAIDAYARYGKGRHPAALNFGDCFAYACAKHFDVPLLYKGNDFAQTDIGAA